MAKAGALRIEREEPDIVIALETDAWWEKQLNCLQATYPHTLQCALDNLYGMHLYSRLPLKNPQLEYLVQEGVPSMHALLQLPCGRHVLLHALHPAPPFPGENDEAQPRDIEILVVARSLEKHAGKPVIVAGDMNDVPWSRTLRGFLATSGLGDPRRGRGLYNTYHASHRLMRWPLDHVFVSRHFAVERVARSHPIGSDHFAYFTRLRLLCCAAARRRSSRCRARLRSRRRSLRVFSAGSRVCWPPSITSNQVGGAGGRARDCSAAASDSSV